MRLSKLYLPTLREVPGDAEIASHQLMLRAGMIRRTVVGIYSYLPLGLRVLSKIENIVRKHMDAAGSQEVRMSVVQPREIWDASGRWEKYGPEMFKLEDRHGREFSLGPTAEEYFSFLVKDELNSYKQLPLNLYQIQIKYRDEKRPRFGLNRSREFLMKDAYSYDRDYEGMLQSFKEMEKAYDAIFTEIGLDYVKVDSDSGQMGGNLSTEFQALADTGEGELLYTEDFHFAASIEKCAVVYSIEDTAEELPMEEVETPGAKTIAALCQQLSIQPEQTVKCIDLLVKGEPVFALIPGDRELNMTKLINYLDVAEHDVEMMDHDTIVKCGSFPGFTGPVHMKGRFIADDRVFQMKNMVVGGNKEDIHIKNVNVPRDFQAEKAGDLLTAREGDMSPDGKGTLHIRRGIEVGQIFGLGTQYAESQGAGYLDENQQKKPFYMGSYGVGISRTITAVIEQNHDDNGIIWPLVVAPYHVIISIMNVKDEAQLALGEQLYKDLSKDWEVLLDDRKERPGVKFNDRDLIGIPLRITVGKGAAEQIVEFSHRRSPKEVREVSVSDIAQILQEEKAKEDKHDR
ncbi:MAG: proline--tRNA ligase [Tissierellia bacterium]|nr:proline--tRNA ligase [Tissierellia bacterium]